MCPEEEILAAWLDGALVQPEKEQVTRHLEQCPLCLEKIFFLKKALAREPFFLKETRQTTLKKLVCALQEKGLTILETLNGFSCESFSMAFRNSQDTRTAIRLHLDDLELILEGVPGKGILVSAKKTGPLTIKNISGRILFEGQILSSEALSFEEKGLFKFFSRSEEIEVEIQ